MIEYIKIRLGENPINAFTQSPEIKMELKYTGIEIPNEKIFAQYQKDQIEKIKQEIK